MLGSSANRLLQLAVFVIMFVVFSIFARNFLTIRNIINLLVQTSTLTICSLGATLVLVIGCVDFSLGAIVALSGIAVIAFGLLGLPMWLAMAAATGLGGVIGLINGFLVAKLRLSSFVTTLAMAMLVGGLLAFAVYPAVTMLVPSAASHPNDMDHLGDLANSPIFAINSQDAAGAPVEIFPGIPSLVIIMVIIAVLAHVFLKHSRFGRYLILTGANPAAAYFSGIHVVRVKIMAFVLAGLLAAFTGVLLTSRIGIPGGGGGYEMLGIECAMIGGASLVGGTGSVAGTVIGSFLLTTLAMGLTMLGGDNIYIPLFSNGLILIGVVGLDQIRTRDWAKANETPSANLPEASLS